MCALVIVASNLPQHERKVIPFDYVLVSNAGEQKDPGGDAASKVTSPTSCSAHVFRCYLSVYFLSIDMLAAFRSLFSARTWQLCGARSVRWPWLSVCTACQSLLQWRDKSTRTPRCRLFAVKCRCHRQLLLTQPLTIGDFLARRG